MIRSANTSDAKELSSIYNHYISNTVITFEESTISSDEMSNRINEISSLDLPWLVAEDSKGIILGYAFANKWKGRSAYRFSVEVSAYLAQSATSKGLGSKLYAALFNELKNRSIHTVIGGISLPNPASIALHEKFNMKKVAHFYEVGFKFNKWVDVGYWQGKIDTDSGSEHSLPLHWSGMS